MLVATVLVVLIMLLFAQIFGGAIGTISNSRSLANNDQKARTFVDIVANDLKLATFRQAASAEAQGITPFGPNDAVDSRQFGFFHISENDPFNNGDDVLHFTVSLAETLRSPVVSNPNAAPFFGRAVGMGPANPNQPDWDDGVYGNQVGASRAAEIVIFLRNGNLYRRVMLIRDAQRSAPPPFDTQPTTGTGGLGGQFARFQNPYPPSQASPPRSFYNDWDYSGTRIYAGDTNTNMMVDPEPTDSYRFHFHGLESLDNSLGLANLPLAVPGNRFGFHPSNNLPREYLNRADAVGTSFIGRFTHEETSAADNNTAVVFDWPGQELGGANVLLRNDLVLQDGVIIHPNGPTPLTGPRAGEDILLTGVEGFDVDVWDPLYAENDVDGDGAWRPFTQDDPNGNGVQETAGAFVDLGHASRFRFGASVRPRGAFGHLANRNKAFGGRNVSFGPDGAPGVAGVDDDGDGNTDTIMTMSGMTVPDPKEIGWPTSDDTINRVFDTWHPSFGAGGAPFRPLKSSGNVGVAPVAPLLPPGPWSNPARPGLGQVFIPDANATIAFRVILSVDDTANQQPEWPRTPGAIVQDGGITWQAFDNRIGLEKIRITLYLRDANTGNPRQVTLVHSFVE